MNDVLLENRQLKSDLQILRARYEGKSAAADHFFGQLMRERRRLTMVRRALATLANDGADTSRRAIEEIE